MTICYCGHSGIISFLIPSLSALCCPCLNDDLMDGVTFQFVKGFLNSFNVIMWEIFSINNPFLLSVSTVMQPVSFLWANNKFHYFMASLGSLSVIQQILQSFTESVNYLTFEVLFPTRPGTESWPRLQWVNPWQKIQIDSLHIIHHPVLNKKTGQCITSKKSEIILIYHQQKFIDLN